MALTVFDYGKYGVHLFFVISGFVIPWSMYHSGYQIKNIFKFTIKRLIRLEPPYLVSIIVALAILWARQNILGLENTHITVSIDQVLLHFGYLIPFFKDYQWLNNVYWTLAIEFQYYILIACLFTLLLRLNNLGIGMMVIASCTLSHFTNSIFIFYWFPFFLVGILLFLFKINRLSIGYFYGLLLLICCYNFYEFTLGAILYSLIPVFCILMYNERKVFALDFLGKFSYSIYLIHPLIGASLINYLSHNYTGTIEKIGVIVSGIVVTLISSYLMYFFVERPSKRLSSKLAYSK